MGRHEAIPLNLESSNNRDWPTGTTLMQHLSRAVTNHSAGARKSQLPHPCHAHSRTKLKVNLCALGHARASTH